MFNLKKLIKLVKEGMFSCDAFDRYNDSYNTTIEQEDKTEEDRMADEWLAQQEFQSGQGGAIAPAPSNIPVQLPYQVNQLPEDVEDMMMLWLVNSIPQIKQELNRGAEGLERNKNETPEESTIDLYPPLAKELRDHEEYKPFLSEKINNLLSPYEKSLYPDIDLGDLFVETMLNKAHGLQSDLEAIQQREKEEGKANIGDFWKEKKDKENVGVLSIQGDVVEAFSPSRLTDGEKIRIMNEVGLEDMYDDEQLVNAVSSAFNSKSGVDDRFVFFLKNPQFLMPILSNYPTLGQSLEDIGIDTRNIESVFPTIKGVSNQKSVIDALSDIPHGQAILDELDRLIKTKDISIARYFAGGLKFKNKSYHLSIDQRKEEMGGSRGQEAGVERVRKETASEIQNQRGMEGLAKRIASVVRYYLEDHLNDMKSMNEDSTMKAMEQYRKDIKEIEEEMRLNPDNESLRISLTRAKFNYAFADELNAFFISAQSQLHNVFDQLGYTQRSLKNPNMIYYGNNFGSVAVPISVLKDIFGGGALSRDIDPKILIKNYKPEVDKYKEKIRNGEISDGYKPNWKYMVNNRLAYNAVADFGDVKNFIREGIEKYGTIGNLLNHLSAYPIYDKKIGDFAGVKNYEKGKSEGEKKKADYIEYTIGQDYAFIKYPIEVFKWKQKFDEKKKNFPDQKYNSKIPGYETMITKGIMRSQDQEKQFKKIMEEEEQAKVLIKEEGEEKVKDNVGGVGLMHSMKTRIGDSIEYILPQLADLAISRQESSDEEKEAVRSFVDLFDHNPAKLINFSGYGRYSNPRDEKKRTNTELYYIATQKPMPKHIKQLLDLNKSKEYWKKTVFKLYDVYAKEHNNLLNQNSLIQDRKDLIDKVQEEVVDKKLPGILELRYKEDSDSLEKWNKILEKVPLDEYQDFINFMSEWEYAVDKKPVPPKYLLWVGLKQPYKTIINLMRQIGSDTDTENVKDKGGFRDKARKSKNKAEEIWLKIEKLFREHGRHIDRPALKISYVKYKNMMTKISRLTKIKNSSYKFAFINKRSIDDMIEVLRKDFDNFFDGLFE